MQLPRPYDNRWMIQGTRGIYNEQRNAVYLTGLSPEYHEWESFDPYQEKYDTAWWKAIRNSAGELGHGGTDYLELKLFVAAVRNKTQTPLDVYDAVIKSANGPLSEESIAKGSRPSKFPILPAASGKPANPVSPLRCDILPVPCQKYRQQEHSMKYEWKEIAQESAVHRPSRIAYSKDRYDIDRFKRLREISARIMSDFTDSDMEKIETLYNSEKGYLTPKVDIRAVIFQDEKILLVKERDNQKWSLPGGWADVGLSPAENAVKEVEEESGLKIEPVRLLAVWDKRFHDHPPDPFHVYKLCFLCKIIGGHLSPGFETSEARFFAEDEIPPLSTNRTTNGQIRYAFDYHRNPRQEAAWE